MIKRMNRWAMYNLLEQHPEWNVANLASSNAGWKYGNMRIFIQVLLIIPNIIRKI